MRNFTKIQIYHVQTRAGWRWQVRHMDPADGKVKRPTFTSEAEAEKFAKAVLNQNRDAVSKFATLPADDQVHLLQVWSEAKKRGVDLMAAVLAAKPTVGEKVSLQSVINELIGVKRKAGRDAGYLDGLENILWKFAQGIESKAVDTVDVTVLENFLHAANLESRSTLRARLSTLFNFAVRRGYLLANPCNRLERITVARPPNRVMSVGDVTRFLNWAKVSRPGMLPWFVLSTFCGLRPEEAQLTTAKEINFDEGWVKVEAQTTKIRMRRVVYPKAEAMVLLQAAVKFHREISLSNKGKSLGQRAALAVLGWPEWYQDITRHTAASMWVAAEPDVAKVAAMLGNSPAVLLKHYKALVTKKEAAAFWRLSF